MGNVGGVGGPAAQQQVNQAKGPQKAAGSEQISGAQARATSEKAYDNLFFATSGTGEGLASARSDIVVQQEDRVSEALLLFGDLKEGFLKEAPKGAIAEAFSELQSLFDKYGTTEFDNGELRLFTKSSDGELVQLDAEQRKEISASIDEALDKFWTKVIDNTAEPGKLRETPAFAFLNTPRAQQIMKTLAPVVQKLWSPPAKVDAESMSGAKSAAGLGEAKAALEKAEAEEATSTVSVQDAKVFSGGLEQLLKLGGDNVDIETLIMMVMMETGKDAAIDMRESMKVLHARTEEKRQVRAQMQAMKAEHQMIEVKLRDEWEKDKHDGLISQDCSFETYQTVRTIQWGTFDPATGKVVPQSEIVPMNGPYPPTVGPSQTLKDVYDFFETPGAKMKAGDGPSEAIKQMQMMLALAGFPCPNTGMMDTATIEALNKLKGAASMSQDGTVDSNTFMAMMGWAKMVPEKLGAHLKSGGSLKEGDTEPKDAIRELQQLLKDAGYNVTISATMDASFMGVLKQLIPDGKVNASNVLELLENIKSRSNLTPTQRFDAMGGQLKTAPPAPKEGMSNLTGAQWDSLVDNLQTKLDTLGDQTQEDQMKMQSTLDRYTKAFDTLSNIMKKISQSAETIVGNMK